MKIEIVYYAAYRDGGHSQCMNSLCLPVDSKQDDVGKHARDICAALGRGDDRILSAVYFDPEASHADLLWAHEHERWFSPLLTHDMIAEIDHMERPLSADDEITDDDLWAY